MERADQPGRGPAAAQVPHPNSPLLQGRYTGRLVLARSGRICVALLRVATEHLFLGLERNELTFPNVGKGQFVDFLRPNMSVGPDSNGRAAIRSVAIDGTRPVRSVPRRW